MKTIKRVIGVDPGKDAGLSYIIRDKGVWDLVYIGPYDELLLEKFVVGGYTQDLAVALEKAQASPQMGVVSAFNYGVTYGRILNAVERVVKDHDLLGTFVSPVTWKMQFGLLKKPKNASIKKVKSVFSHSEQDLLKKITHHHADSALIGLSVVMHDK